MKVPLQNPNPDVEHFVRVIRGEVIPKRPPLAELFLDHEVEREIAQTCLGLSWVEPGTDRESIEAYLRNRTEVYYRMGYDYIRVSGGVDFPGDYLDAADTADLSRGNRHWANEDRGPIASWEEFEKYPWPDPAKADLRSYEYAASNLPEGMGLFVCPTSGFLEIPLDTLLGYQNLCYLIYEQPDLVEAVFQRVGEIIYAMYERLLGLPNLRAFFQGDDMGFKTGTLIAPDQLRALVLPWHKKLAALAHKNDLVYLLHSCGNLDAITDDLINDVRIDARHSYEDEGNSVLDFKKRHGANVAILGGIDVDKLSRLPEEELRAHVRMVMDACMPGGRFALGSGNTVCNYVPLKNYFAMVEEAFNYAGC
jgi:uroporphyrinogen decarboxylase